MITKDLKRLGYETDPRGPATEIQNQGPSEGIGLVQKSAANAKKNRKKEMMHLEPQVQEDPEAIQAAPGSAVEEGYVGGGSQVEEI